MNNTKSSVLTSCDKFETYMFRKQYISTSRG